MRAYLCVGAAAKLMQMGALTPKEPSTPRPMDHRPSPAMKAPPVKAAYASALRGDFQRQTTRSAVPKTTPTM